MMIRWLFSAELRRSMSNVVLSGRKGVPCSGSRGFHSYGGSGLSCSLPSSTYAHSAAASGIPPRISFYSILSRTLSSSSSREPATDAASSPHFGSNNSEGEKDSITLGEAKKLMRLANVGSLKEKLGTEGKEVIGYKELIDESINIGISKSPEEAAAFVRSLDEAGVILLFRDKVYLHPDKVVKLVSKAVPLALSPQDNPMWDELKKLQERKEEIDVLAHKQVRRVLWSGLGFAILQVGLFFRLTFWEFSWDVMEPIAFFTTTTGLVIGYAYFLFTSRDPTYQDFMNKLFLLRQRKLLKKHSFDIDRFVELQKKCNCPHHANISIKNRVGLDLDLEDACHKH